MTKSAKLTEEIVFAFVHDGQSDHSRYPLNIVLHKQQKQKQLLSRGCDYDKKHVIHMTYYGLEDNLRFGNH